MIVNILIKRLNGKKKHTKKPPNFLSIIPTKILLILSTLVVTEAIRKNAKLKSILNDFFKKEKKKASDAAAGCQSVDKIFSLHLFNLS